MERIKLLITLDLDPETGETTCVDRQIINDDIKKVSKKPSKKTSKDEDTTPRLVLDSSKYILNSAAIELLQVEAGDRIDIKYEQSGTTVVPIIGTSEAFGTPNSGNKLTKSNTVACRGKANVELSKYGDSFTFESTSDGLFKLVGNKATTEEVADDNISLPDDDLTIPEDDELELGDLINELDFSLN